MKEEWFFLIRIRRENSFKIFLNTIRSEGLKLLRSQSQVVPIYVRLNHDFWEKGGALRGRK